MLAAVAREESMMRMMRIAAVAAMLTTFRGFQPQKDFLQRFDDENEIPSCTSDNDRTRDVSTGAS
jgi:hypothetical protein